MRTTIAPFWQQKQPTPSSRQWEFHWHPADLPAGLTDTLSQLDVGLVGAGVACFAVGDDFVAWGRSFSARAPSEQRAYVGLAGAYCLTDGIHAPAAMAALAQALPDAAPHTGAATARTVTLTTARLADPGPLPRDSAAALARLVWRGERVPLPQPPGPAEVGALLGWLPAADRPGRKGILVAGTPPAATGAEPVVHYLTRLWSEPDQAQARAAWQLVLDAAAASGEPFGDFFAGLSRLAEAWDSPGSLARFLADVLGPDEIRRPPAPLLATDVADAGELWARVLHYWGRGFLSDGARDRLAVLGARRVIVDHLVALDEARPALRDRYLRRLRYESVLTSAKVEEMLGAMRRIAPGLGAIQT